MKPIHESHAPTTEELAFAFGGAGTPALSAPDDPVKAAPEVRWLTDKKRTESYVLLYPFEFEGVEYRVVTLKRLSAREVDVFMDKMRASGGTGLRWPLYYVGDVEMPDAVWGALDDDDRFALGEIGSDFLPARFRQETAAAQA